MPVAVRDPRRRRASPSSWACRVRAWARCWASSRRVGWWSAASARRPCSRARSRGGDARRAAPPTGRALSRGRAGLRAVGAGRARGGAGGRIRGRDDRAPVRAARQAERCPHGFPSIPITSCASTPRSTRRRRCRAGRAARSCASASGMRTCSAGLVDGGFVPGVEIAIGAVDEQGGVVVERPDGSSIELDACAAASLYVRRREVPPCPPRRPAGRTSSSANASWPRRSRLPTVRIQAARSTCRCHVHGTTSLAQVTHHGLLHHHGPPRCGLASARGIDRAARNAGLQRRDARARRAARDRDRLPAQLADQARGARADAHRCADRGGARRASCVDGRVVPVRVRAGHHGCRLGLARRAGAVAAPSQRCRWCGTDGTRARGREPAPRAEQRHAPAGPAAMAHRPDGGAGALRAA